MRQAPGYLLMIAGAAMLLAPQVLAQSGVLSGPPQVSRDAVDDGPGRRRDDPPGGRPGLRSQDEPPGGRPGPRAQDDPPRRPGLRSQDEPPGSRDRDDDRRRADTWIAVAGGFDGKGQNVGVGYSGHVASRAGAEDEALRACNRYGRGVRCRDPFAVSTGCIYIVPGTKRGGVTWGRGSTPNLALEQCRKGGYTCESKRVVGGCVPGDR